MPEKKKRSEDARFFTLFSTEVDFCQKLAPFLNTQDASALRPACRLMCTLVAACPWPHYNTPRVVDYSRWRSCFPNAKGLYLVPRSKRTRDYDFKGVQTLNVDYADLASGAPTRMFKTADALETLQIENSPLNVVSKICFFLPKTLTNFHAKVDNAAVLALSNVSGILSISNSRITNGSLRFLHPELEGLNIGGCWGLTDDELEHLGCKHLSLLNMSYTRFSNAGVLSIPNVGQIELFVFGENPNIDDNLLDFLPGLKTLYLFMDVSPFSAARVDALRRRGVEVVDAE
jgi:hypothetical protein